jgi:nitric oxide reductase large subunit
VKKAPPISTPEPEVPTVSPERQAEIDASLHRVLLIFTLVTLGLGLLVLFLLCKLADNDWHNFSAGEFIILWLMVSFLVGFAEAIIIAALPNTKS